MRRHSWKTIRSKIVHRNAWLELQENQVSTPSGKSATYTFITAKPFVIVVARKEQQLLMIKQFRYPIKQTLLEFPAGGIEPRETPLSAAKRELEEETGYVARKWKSMGQIYELTSMSYQKGYLFLAWDIERKHEPSHLDESIEDCEFVTINKLEELIRDGSILDALTPAAFFRIKPALND